MPHERVTISMGIDQEGKLLGATLPKGRTDEILSTCVQAALANAPFPRSHAGVISITKTYEEIVAVTAAPRGRRQTASVRQAVTALVALLVMGALVACGSSPPQPLVGGDPTVAKKPIVPVSAQAVVGHMLGSIADRTIGPFLARIPGQGGVVAWVTPAEGSAREDPRRSDHGRR